MHFLSVSQPDDTALLISGGLVPGEVVHLVQRTGLALTPEGCSRVLVGWLHCCSFTSVV